MKIPARIKTKHNLCRPKHNTLFYSYTLKKPSLLIKTRDKMPVLDIPELFIIQHNVRHYINNKGLLHADWCKENPDVILLNSTSLNPKENSHISFKSSKSDYKVYTTPKGNHNGSAILVKKINKSLPCKHKR